MSPRPAESSLLYRAIRRLFGLSLELYFVDVQVRGRDNVPARGPLILAANHPNSVMDAVVLSTQTARPINYLGRSGLFRNRVVGSLLRRCGVVPVYRAEDGPADPAGNRDAFRACFAILEAGGAIGVFPEGRNAPERQVQEIKAGTARMALGAEARNDFALGVQIVPVGLNFEDRDGFFSRVLVRFGPPIDARAYRDAWHADPSAATAALTDELQEGMRREAVHVHDEQHTELVADIAAIHGASLLGQLVQQAPAAAGLDRRILDRVRAASGDKPDLHEYFSAKQHIADVVRHHEERNPAELERMRRRIRRYKEHLRQVRLRWDFAERDPETVSVRREGVKMTLYAVLLAPLALWGVVHNMIPYWLTGLAAGRASDEAMRAITWLTVGLLVFPAFWGLFALAAWEASGSTLRTALYVTSLPFAGLWALRYRHELERYNDRIVARTLLVSNRRMMEQLIAERRRLLAMLDRVAAEYLRAQPDATTRDAAG